jgi:broad-specificity NMP kinase
MKITMRIMVASTKGGVGKSTVARHIVPFVLGFVSCGEITANSSLGQIKGQPSFSQAEVNIEPLREQLKESVRELLTQEKETTEKDLFSTQDPFENF